MIDIANNPILFTITEGLRSNVLKITAYSISHKVEKLMVQKCSNSATNGFNDTVRAQKYLDAPTLARQVPES